MMLAQNSRAMTYANWWIIRPCKKKNRAIGIFSGSAGNRATAKFVMDCTTWVPRAESGIHLTLPRAESSKSRDIGGLWCVGRYGALAMLGILGVVLLFVGIRRRTRRITAAKASATETELDTPPRERRFQYSLQSMMILVTVAAVLCSIFRIAPPAGIFILSVAVFLFCTASAAILTYLRWRGSRRVRFFRKKTAAKRDRAFLAIVFLISWFFAYALSMAPVTTLISYLHLRWPPDTYKAVVYGVYAPMNWLLVDCGIGNWRPVRMYFEGVGMSGLLEPAGLRR